MAVLALVGLLGFGLIAKGSGNLEVGEPVPDAELPRLDGSGTGTISEYRGRWVLVNFWASWCLPCRDETPALQRFHERHRDERFTVLGINQRDLSDDALAFLDEFDVTYPHLRDRDGDRAEPFGMTGLPESFLVDPEGGVALIRRGPVDDEYLNTFVLPLLRGELEASSAEQ